jgi:hypothetical protein
MDYKFIKSLSIDELFYCTNLIANYVKGKEGILQKTIEQKIEISSGYLSRLKVGNLSKNNVLDIFFKLCTTFEISITEEQLTSNNLKNFKVIEGFEIDNFQKVFACFIQNESTRILKNYIYLYNAIEKKHYIIDKQNDKIIFLATEKFSYSYLEEKSNNLEFNKFENKETLNIVLNDNIDKAYYNREVYWGLHFSSNLKSGKILLLNINYENDTEIDNIIECYFSQNKLLEDKELLINNFQEFKKYILENTIKDKTYFIKLPEELISIYQQFLNYFVDYVKITKGCIINFNTSRQENFLEIKIQENDDTNIEIVTEYLKEYMLLTKQKVDSLQIPIQTSINDNDLNIFLLDLKSQINFLNQRLEIAALKNDLLDQQVSFYKKQMTDKIQLLPQQKIFKNEFVFLKDLIAKGRIEECVETLLNDNTFKSDKKFINSIIMQSSKLSTIKSQKQLGVIEINEYNQELLKISHNLLELIDEQ